MLGVGRLTVVVLGDVSRTVLALPVPVARTVGKERADRAVWVPCEAVMFHAEKPGPLRRAEGAADVKKQSQFGNETRNSATRGRVIG